jgi:hypothetical protein
MFRKRAKVRFVKDHHFITREFRDKLNNGFILPGYELLALILSWDELLLPEWD